MTAAANRPARGGANQPEDLPANLETPAEREAADFTMEAGTLRLIPLALLIGAAATGIALVLLGLIGLVTNALYNGRIDVALTPPDPTRLGWLSVGIPVVGGLVIGVMARFGSERIRGHGIPEAMETILVGGSRVEPKLAILKPVSSAISIGSGGPFGAEGPIILTGGAVGSVLGQLFHLSAAERKTLLVSGAAAGMTAVFAAPVAAVVLSAELLLFEWKPRSLVPVAAACAIAAVLRMSLVDVGALTAAPLFPIASHQSLTGLGLAGSLAIGAIGGSRLGAHDRGLRRRGSLRAPADPLDVVAGDRWSGRRDRGHDRSQLARGGLQLDSRGARGATRHWCAGRPAGGQAGDLGGRSRLWHERRHPCTGTDPGRGRRCDRRSMAAAGGPGVWALLGMTAALAGVTRSPLTSIFFAVEATHDQELLLPLMVASFAAYAISVLVLKRSILTEKVARRGFHVMREYAVDPLEALLVRDVMTSAVLTVQPDRPISELAAIVDFGHNRRQRLYPVVSGDDQLRGVISRGDLARSLREEDGKTIEPGVTAERAERSESGESTARTERTVASVMREAVVAYPDETLRAVADRMAAGSRGGVLPVVDRKGMGRLQGLISQFDLLRARDRLLIEERHRERVIRLRILPSFRRRRDPRKPD